MEKEGKTTREENQGTAEAAAPATKGEMTQKGGMQTSTRARVMVALVAVPAYMIIFILLSYNVGHGMAITVVPLVILVAWFFGLVPGICAGVISLPLNFVMSVVVGLSWWDQVFMRGAGISGTAGCIIIGAIVGGMRDLAIKINMEIFERKRAEEDVREHRDRLDEQAQELQDKNKKLMGKINQRKQTVNELQETKEQMEHLIETSLDPIIVGDSKGRIAKPNKTFLAMIGYSEEEVIGQPPYAFSVSSEGTYESTTGELIHIGEEFFKETFEKIAEFREERKLSNWLSYYVNKENKIVPITQNFVSLHNEKGERTGTFAIIRDITEQRKAELELIRSKEAAEEANQSKSAFLANMSHEIRTPMNAVIGFTDMLVDTGLDPEQEDYARTIKKSGEALLSLINDILDFSKIEAGKIDIEGIDFDIEVLAYDICELIRLRLIKNDVEILCRIGDNLPAQVKGDPHRFRQVIINLMANAAKFTDRGEIELSLDLEAERDGRVMIHARVRDTGIGIPEDKLEDIFELFHQVDASATRKYGGAGLGLSISKKIANLMGGNVWAESPANCGMQNSECGIENKKSRIGGSGSIFHFKAWLKQSEKKQVKRFAPVSLSGKKVLITDDNETNLEILVHVIESAEMHVTFFTSGEEALKAVQGSFEKNDPFDICILDIMMPGISGYEVAENIRSLFGDSMPLLAFSSSTEGGAGRSQEAGFNGFLSKPINRIKLFKMMGRLLGEAKDREQQEERKNKIVTQYSMREDAKYSISILLAEDNPVNQKLAVKLLTKAGYRVDVADNGREAFEKFAEEPEKYDIIFMDVQMPEINGLDATKKIREFELRNSGIEELNNSEMEAIDINKSKIDSAELVAGQNPKSKINEIPIVAMTAEAMREDREKCLASGMNDYIPKPIKRGIVFDMLKKWVIEKI